MRQELYHEFLLEGDSLFLYDRITGKVFRLKGNEREELTDPSEVLHLLTGSAKNLPPEQARDLMALQG